MEPTQEEVAEFVVALARIQRHLLDLKIRARRHPEVTAVSHEWSFLASGPRLDCSVLADLHGGHWLYWTLAALLSPSRDKQSSWQLESAIYLGLGPGEYSADERVLHAFSIKDVRTPAELPNALIHAASELTDTFTIEELLRQAQPIRAAYLPSP